MIGYYKILFFLDSGKDIKKDYVEELDLSPYMPYIRKDKTMTIDVERFVFNDHIKKGFSLFRFYSESADTRRISENLLNSIKTALLHFSGYESRLMGRGPFKMETSKSLATKITKRLENYLEQEDFYLDLSLELEEKIKCELNTEIIYRDIQGMLIEHIGQSITRFLPELSLRIIIGREHLFNITGEIYNECYKTNVDYPLYHNL